MEQKTVFISYRRSMSKHLARSVYQDLQAHGWDAFLDVNTIDSGDFDQIILHQIGARAHFVLLISKGALERCANPNDWVLREIVEAVRLERNIVPILEEGADFNREMSYLPADLRAIVSKKNALPLNHFYFDAAVEMLRNRFLKTPIYVNLVALSPDEQAEVQRRMANLAIRPTSLSLMPEPFAWAYIPDGNVTLHYRADAKLPKTYTLPAYEIGKYPITNGQFAKFVDAKGYDNPDWWTEQGWQARQAFDWTQPLFWEDANWNGVEHPVVGVSWHEAVAFCRWLRSTTGEQISLPTEPQWQRAAQAMPDGGVSGQVYPWGEEWEGEKCNSSVMPQISTSTTAVTAYEQGRSPCGVVDLIGNVWEWCLDRDHLDVGENSDADMQALRGAYWGNDNPDYFAATYPNWIQVDDRDNYVGFRVVRVM